MTFEKIRTNVYLDKKLKDQAKEFFKSYGLSLSDGLNFLLKKTLDKKDLDLDMQIEPILPSDSDYKIAKNAYENYKKHPEDYIDFDEWKKNLNV